VEDWSGGWHDFRLYRSECAELWYLVYFKANFDFLVFANRERTPFLDCCHFKLARVRRGVAKAVVVAMGGAKLVRKIQDILPPLRI